MKNLRRVLVGIGIALWAAGILYVSYWYAKAVETDALADRLPLVEAKTLGLIGFGCSVFVLLIVSALLVWAGIRITRRRRAAADEN